MSGKGSKGRPSTPAITPGAVPANDEPEASLPTTRNRAPAPPQNVPTDSKRRSPKKATTRTHRGVDPDSPRSDEPTVTSTLAAPFRDDSATSASSISSKGRRTTAPATLPGAIAVAAEEPTPSATAVPARADSSSSFASSVASSATTKGKQRTSARATVPGAVSSVITEETDAGDQNNRFSSHAPPTRVDSGSSRASSGKGGRSTTRVTTPGAVHVHSSRDLNVLPDVDEQLMSAMESDLEIKARSKGDASMSGQVSTDHDIALQSVENDALAKIRASASSGSFPGARGMPGNGEAQDATTSRKDRRARHSRRNNRGDTDGSIEDRQLSTTNATSLNRTIEEPVDDDGPESNEPQHENWVPSFDNIPDFPDVTNISSYEKNEQDLDKASLDGSYNEQDPAFIDNNHDDPQVIVNAARGVSAAPGVEYATDVYGGQTTGGTGAEHLTVAVAVSEDEDQMFLPSAIEYDPDAKPPLFKNRRFRLYAFVLICVAFIIVIGLILGLVVFAPGSATYAPTISPSLAPTETSQGMYISAFEDRGVQSVSIRNSPADRATRWIIEEDPRELASNDPGLLQRFLLAMFYFDTTDNGRNPWRSCNPPPPNSDGKTPPEGSPENICFAQELAFDQNGDVVFDTSSDASARWLSGEHECNWFGNFCDEINITRVIELVGQNISGTLPTELALFDALQSITLSRNEFTGTLPTEWGSMRHLLNIEVHYNNLSGSIPPELYEATLLQALNLGSNMFTGTLSTEIGLLTSLKGVFTFDNLLTGTFPTEIENLESLVYTRHSGNIYNGTIPSGIGNLVLLQELWMSQNLFSGMIPSDLGNLVELTDLDIGSNKLSGTIPSSIYGLTLLQYLNLSSNNFLKGTINTAIGNLTDLLWLQLSRNQFTGTIPTELINLGNIQLVWLHLNQLEGSVPGGLCFLQQLSFLQILQSDCLPEVGAPNPCACCTACCNQNTEICQILQ